jgi:hypothetical protein
MHAAWRQTSPTLRQPDRQQAAGDSGDDDDDEVDHKHNGNDNDNDNDNDESEVRERLRVCSTSGASSAFLRRLRIRAETLTKNGTMRELPLAAK